MKYKILLLFLFSLQSLTYTSETCNEKTRLLLLSARTDQYDVTSIKSLKLDDLDDTTLNEALTNAYNTVRLIAQHNKLSQPKPVRFTSVETIDFSHGTIKTLSIGDWVKVMPSLRVLKLAHNKISSIASDFDVTRSSCGPCGRQVLWSWRSSSLQELDLSHNELTEFDLNIPNNATNLTKANFSHNKISRVIIPEIFNHRKICEILLHNNQLNSDDQMLLEKYNIRDTEKYEKSMGNHQIVGMLTGIGTGVGSMVIMVISLANQMHPAALVFLEVGAVVFQAVAGTFLGYGIKKCTSRDDQNTYKPFIFIFDEQQKSDHVAIQLEAVCHDSA